jgi:hypothetical protein
MQLADFRLTAGGYHLLLLSPARRAGNPGRFLCRADAPRHRPFPGRAGTARPERPRRALGMPALDRPGLRRFGPAASGMPVARALPRRRLPDCGRRFAGTRRARAPARARVAAALRGRRAPGYGGLRCTRYRGALLRGQARFRLARAAIVNGFPGRCSAGPAGARARVFALHGRRGDPVRRRARHALPSHRLGDTARAVALDLGIT